VVGDGVVGQQPVLGPGSTHEYQSFCVLKSPRDPWKGSITSSSVMGSHWSRRSQVLARRGGGERMALKGRRSGWLV
jgi:uncharacterized protein affecting Mg2+/Co2+ transport